MTTSLAALSSSPELTNHYTALRSLRRGMEDLS
jgi:hypothetical protein